MADYQLVHLTNDRLTIFMLGNFSCFCCHLLTFSKIKVFKKSFRNTIRVSNRLDPDRAQQNVGPDLGPICLQRLSEDNKKLLLSRKELNIINETARNIWIQ